MSTSFASNRIMNTTFDADMMFSAPLPMKKPAAPTMQKHKDSKHTWKLVLIKDNGEKLIRFCSTKKHALAVGRAVHNAKTRPTKMFSVTKA